MTFNPLSSLERCNDSARILCHVTYVGDVPLLSHYFLMVISAWPNWNRFFFNKSVEARSGFFPIIENNGFPIFFLSFFRRSWLTTVGIGKILIFRFMALGYKDVRRTLRTNRRLGRFLPVVPDRPEPPNRVNVRVFAGHTKLARLGRRTCPELTTQIWPKSRQSGRKKRVGTGTLSCRIYDERRNQTAYRGRLMKPWEWVGRLI